MKRRYLTDRIQKVVVAERSALLAGDFEALAILATEKEELARALDTAETGDRHRLRALAAELRRNERLLARAVEGIHEVTARLSKQAEARSSLQTYSRDGKGAMITSMTPRHTRRA